MSAIANRSQLPFSRSSTHGDILDANGNIILEVPIDCSDEDAAFIVRACNSHAALVEALEEVKPIMAYLAHTAEPDPDFDKALGEKITAINMKLTATLALAKGE